jgi:hypothetical protein
MSAGSHIQEQKLLLVIDVGEPSDFGIDIANVATK